MNQLVKTEESLLYFNSANLSICPPTILEATERYRREFEKNPTQGLKNAWKQLWQVQTSLAEFFGARPNDLILRTNVTEVLNTFILGYPLQPKDEILIGELEYGAIGNICQFRAQRDNLNLRVLKIPQSQAALVSMTEDSLVELICSQFSPQTRVLVISHIIASLGLKIPIEKLGKTTRKLGIALIIDGAYAPGAIPINFECLDEIDFYGCSLYKWMLGPKGTGFGWVHPIHQRSLIPLQAGWTTFESAGSFSQFGGGSRFQEKFQLSGCRDFAPFYAIQDLLEFWESWPTEKIQEHIFKMNRDFQKILVEAFNVQPLVTADPHLQGPMTVFRWPQKLQNFGSTLADKILNELNIQMHCTQLSTGWHGILSPHIQNSEEEIHAAKLRFKKLF